MECQGEKIKDDFLTCPLCLELYTEPKVLSCQHTFCLQCLRQYMQSMKASQNNCCCPLCKELTVIPSNDVQQLKNNFLVIGLLQCFNAHNGSKKNSNLPDTEPGDNCPACDERRECTNYCNECRMWLCGTCVRSHNKLPATKGHLLLSCHDIQEDVLKRLKQMHEVLRNLYEETETQLSDVTLERQTLAEKGALASAAVNASAKELQEIIEDKCRKIISEICCQVSSTDDHIQKVQSEMELRKVQLEKAIKMVHEAKASNSQLEKIHVVPEIEQLMRSLIPLSEISAKIKSATALHFRQSLNIPSVLKSEALGHLEKVHHSGIPDIQEIPFYQIVSALLLSHTDNGFVSSIGVTDSAILFAAGYRHVQSLAKGSFKHRPDDFPKPCGAAMWTKPWGIVPTPYQTLLVTDAGTGPGEGFVAVVKNNGHFMHLLAKGMSLPRGVAMYADNVYVCDQEDRCVYVLDYKQCRLVKVLRKDAAGNFLFISPLHITISATGSIIVSDAGQFIKIFSSDFQLRGCYSSSLSDSELWGVCCMGVGGNIYVADWKHGVHVLSAEGRFKGILNSVSGQKILEPTALACNTATGILYVGTSCTQIYALTLV